MTRALTLLCAALLVSCGKSEISREAPRATAFQVREELSTPPASSRPRTPSAPPASRGAWPSLEVKTPVPSVVVAPPAEPRRARDLGAELTAALSSMSACLADATDGPAHSRVGVRARVLPDGAVGQVSVSAPGWPEETRRCFEQVASGARLGGRVQDAPRTVAASVEIARIGGEPTPSPSTPTPPLGGLPIDDVPGVTADGPRAAPLTAAPGAPLEGPRGAAIEDSPGVRITGPEGVAISN